MIYENEMLGAVYVYPKNDPLPANTAENGKKWKAYVCKTIDQLTKEDLNKYIFLTGKFTFDEIKNFFAGSQIPFSFTNNSIEIGNYSFSFEKTGLFACFPSPFNKERYVVMLLQNENAKLLQTSNYLDYVIFTGATPENAKRLLYGKFDESSDGGWKFSEELAFSDVERKEYCKTKCELPRKRQLKANPERVVGHTFTETKRGKEWLLGNSSCRFPDIAVGKENACWAVWEEGGDIFLARMTGDGKVDTWPLENNESDSYNPRIAVSRNAVWIFYVNDQDRFYRLYGRSFDGLRFSDEVLISSKGPFDVVTPDAVSNDKGDITISWCEWKANQRYLKYRTLRSGILGDMTSMNVFPSTYTDNYTNAWYPSLRYDTEGNVWGAWNQHYPSYFGICGGKLSEAAQTITQSAEKMDDWEIGGYPHLFIDGKNGKCVVWESNAWDTYPDKKAQKIKYSQYDPGQKRWAIGTVISLDEQTMLNQAPAGICDSKGTKIVVWSGRGRTLALRR